MAQHQLKTLTTHYETLHRPAASRNLLAALESAKQKTAQNPAAGLPAPRPYPTLQ